MKGIVKKTNWNGEEKLIASIVSVPVLGMVEAIRQITIGMKAFINENNMNAQFFLIILKILNSSFILLFSKTFKFSDSLLMFISLFLNFIFFNYRFYFKKNKK